jgi:hypothetical protein
VKVLAVLMIAVGALMAGSSGLCTVVVSLSASSPSNGPMTGFPLVFMAVVVGGPFIAGGVGLVLGGLSLRRRRLEDEEGKRPA